VTHIRVCVYFPLITLKFHTIAIFLLLRAKQYFTQNSYVRLQFMIIQNSTRLVTPIHSLPLQHWKLSNLYTCYLYTWTRTRLHTNVVHDKTPVTFYSPKYNVNTIEHNVNIQHYVNIWLTCQTYIWQVSQDALYDGYSFFFFKCHKHVTMDCHQR